VHVVDGVDMRAFQNASEMLQNASEMLQDASMTRPNVASCCQCKLALADLILC